MIRAGWDRLRLFNIGELFAHRGRTIMSMAVMAVSAALLVSVFSISGSITGSVDRLTAALGGKAELEISGITDAGFDASLLNEIKTVAGVEAAVPMLRQGIGADAERALLIGADASVSALGSDLDGSLRDQAAKLLVPNGVLVGASMGYREGDTLTLSGITATVAGVLDGETIERINGGHIVIAALPTAQKLTGRTGKLDSIQIIAAPNADVAQLRSALTDKVAGRAVVADPSLRGAQAGGGGVSLVRYSTLASSAAALIVSAFLIYNAMSMAVAQRRPTLSLLRAIGGRRTPMVRDLIAEAALLGLIGGFVGAGIGMIMGRGSIERLPAAIVQSVEARTEYIVPGYAIPVAVAACVLASVAASALAARQVYKVAPIEALAPVGASAADAMKPALRWTAAGLGTVLVVTAVFIARADWGIYSLAAISMSIVGAVVLCFAATGPIVRVIASMARIFGAPGALGATTVERAPRRVWATTMTVMIGVTAVVAMGNATRNMVDSAQDSFDDMAVTGAFVSPSTMEQFPTGPMLPADLKAKIEAIPGVEGAGSAQMAFATVGGGRVMLQAFENGVGRQAATATLTQETLRRMAAGDGVVISRDVSRTLGVKTGDTLDLPTPTGVHQVEILDVIPYFAAIAGVVVLDLGIMQQWYQRPGETILGVDFLPGADADEVRTAIRAVVPPEIEVETGARTVELISGSVKQGTSISNAILWIVVIVATVALLNTLMLSVLERRRELGVLRAMGTSRRFLLRTVLAEAAGIGVIGAALGLAVGAGVHYLATLALTNAVSIDVTYDPGPLLLVYATVALLIALLGSIPPAIRAARLPIVEALAVD